MGSYIEINDTLQITTAQGFPAELDFNWHQQNPLKAADFSDRIFTFSGKPSIRIYHAPPVRTFFAHNIDGKWLYWGQIYVLSQTHDMVEKTTSGTFRIVKIYPPDRMKIAADFLGHNSETDYIF